LTGGGLDSNCVLYWKCEKRGVDAVVLAGEEDTSVTVRDEIF
jgi:hypothetical protein